MFINESNDLKGRLHFRLEDRDGRVVEAFSANNSIVFAGRDLVAKRFVGQAMEPVKTLAVGIDSTAVMGDNAGLGKEIFRKKLREFDAASDLSATPEGRVKLLVSTELDFAEGNGPLTEAGLFNSETDDPTSVMYNRVTFPAVNKTADFKLTLVWEILF